MLEQFHYKLEDGTEITMPYLKKLSMRKANKFTEEVEFLQNLNSDSEDAAFGSEHLSAMNRVLDIFIDVVKTDKEKEALEEIGSEEFIDLLKEYGEKSGESTNTDPKE